LNHYLVFPLVQAAFGLLLLPIVLKSHWRSKVHRLFATYLLGLTAWGILIFLMRASPTTGQALFWDTWAASVLPLMGVIFFHFTVRFAGIHLKRWVLSAAYGICVGIFISARMGWSVIDMKVTAYGYAPIGSPILWFQSLFSFALVVIALVIFVNRTRNASHAEERNRSAYIVTGLILCMTGGIFDMLPIAGLPLYPGAIVGNILFCLFTTLAIVRHHLLDIRIVIRKGAVYLLTSIMIAVPYVGVVLLFDQFIEGVPLWLHAVAVVLIAALLQPLWRVAQEIVNKLFYRQRYDFLKALQEFSLETHHVNDLDKLGISLVRLLAKTLQASFVHLLLPSDSGDYELAASTGRNVDKFNLSHSNPLLRYMKARRSKLYTNDIYTIPYLQSLTDPEISELNKIKAELFVPIATKENDLVGILLLGRKLSDSAYSAEEERLVETVVRRMAAELENARLYGREREMRKQLEEQDRAKTEFLHSVAHELKTPLTAMAASSEVLNKISKRDIDKRLARNINKGAWAMERRVNELLDLASVQIGALKIERRKLDLRQVIETAVSQSEALFLSKGQTINLDLDGAPLEVSADRERLEQVLFNLLSNANKYSPEGSTIAMKVGRRERQVVIELHDCAGPIRKEERIKVFAPYYRGSDQSQRERQPGLGLGLAISKRIIELHGGKIWVDPKPGGNIFAFDLPLEQAEAFGSSGEGGVS